MKYLKTFNESIDFPMLKSYENEISDINSMFLDLEDKGFRMKIASKWDPSGSSDVNDPYHETNPKSEHNDVGDLLIDINGKELPYHGGYNPDGIPMFARDQHETFTMIEELKEFLFRVSNYMSLEGYEMNILSDKGRIFLFEDENRVGGISYSSFSEKFPKLNRIRMIFSKSN